MSLVATGINRTSTNLGACGRTSISADEMEDVVHELHNAEGINGEVVLSALETYGNAIMEQIPHGPTARLRREAETEESHYCMSSARYLLGFDVYPTSCALHVCKRLTLS